MRREANVAVASSATASGRDQAMVVLHRWGKSEACDDLSTLDALLKELDEATADDEHVSVSVRRPDGWSLSFYVSGLVVFENVEDLAAEPKHLRVRTRDEGRNLARLLITGATTALDAQEWLPGNG